MAQRIIPCWGFFATRASARLSCVTRTGGELKADLGLGPSFISMLPPCLPVLTNGKAHSGLSAFHYRRLLGYSLFEARLPLPSAAADTSPRSGER